MSCLVEPVAEVDAADFGVAEDVAGAPSNSTWPAWIIEAVSMISSVSRTLWSVIRMPMPRPFR